MYAKLLRFWTKFKGIYGKLCIRENLYIHILYPVWRISLICPETYTSLNKNNRHYTDVHFWTLLLKTTLILRKVLFQRHSCRHLNFVVCIKIFLQVLGAYMNVKQEFFWIQIFYRTLLQGLDYVTVMNFCRSFTWRLWINET